MKVVLISGKARHGKDTAAFAIKDYLQSKGKRVLIAHYGDLVKYTCKTFFGWNGVKDEAGRTLLQKVGTDSIRAKSPDFWVDYVIGVVQAFPNQRDYILIPDTRFPNEIERWGGIENIEPIHLRVVRKNFVSNLTDEQKNHQSEIALDNARPDVLMENSGTVDEFRTKIFQWLDSIV